MPIISSHSSSPFRSSLHHVYHFHHVYHHHHQPHHHHWRLLCFYRVHRSHFTYPRWPFILEIDLADILSTHGSMQCLCTIMIADMIFRTVRSTPFIRFKVYYNAFLPYWMNISPDCPTPSRTMISSMSPANCWRKSSEISNKENKSSKKPLYRNQHLSSRMMIMVSCDDLNTTFLHRCWDITYTPEVVVHQPNCVDRTVPTDTDLGITSINKMLLSDKLFTPQHGTSNKRLRIWTEHISLTSHHVLPRRPKFMRPFHWFLSVINSWPFLAWG